MKRYLISEASAITGLEAHVLRYWEEELGLEISRNELGHRYYTEKDLEILIAAKEMKNKGYQLKAIKSELLGRADIIPIHMEPETGTEIAKPDTPQNKDLRMEQFKAIIGSVLAETLKESNMELHDKVVKEMDYLFRMNDEAAEDRYKKLDETIRACQRHGRETAVGRENKIRKLKPAKSMKKKKGL